MASKLKAEHRLYSIPTKYRKNLIKLAQGLSGQNPPPEFNMATYFSFEDPGAARELLKLNLNSYVDGDGIEYGPIPKKAYLSPECGTSACAIGHGPLYGFQRKKGETWERYTARVFLPEEEYTSANYERYYLRGDAWQWMFGPSWAEVDNTPKGAAKRIYYFLQHGVPTEDLRMSMTWKSGPLIYKHQRPVLA